MYNDPIIKKYFDLIEASNKTIKRYYQGEPFKVGASELPAIFIAKQETEATQFTNAEDQHHAQFRLTLVVDIRSELNDDKEIVAGIAELMDIMEGRNADYTLKSSSILDILRTNIDVDTANNLRTDLNTVTRIDYAETLNRREKHWFVESTITFVAHFIQTR